MASTHARTSRPFPASNTSQLVRDRESRFPRPTLARAGAPPSRGRMSCGEQGAPASHEQRWPRAPPPRVQRAGTGRCDVGERRRQRFASPTSRGEGGRGGGEQGAPASRQPRCSSAILFLIWRNSFFSRFFLVCGSFGLFG